MNSVHKKTDFLEQESVTLDLAAIKSLIPHRYPMLLVDRLINVVAGESAVGVKCVTANEWFFPGHFPEKPIFPGVLMIEAMAQTAGTLVMYTINAHNSKLVYFMSIDKARFRKPVYPGDVLHFHVQKIQNRGSVWKFTGEAKVNGVLVADATFSAMISDPV